MTIDADVACFFGKIGSKCGRGTLKQNLLWLFFNPSGKNSAATFSRNFDQKETLFVEHHKSSLNLFIVIYSPLLYDVHYA